MIEMPPPLWTPPALVMPEKRGLVTPALFPMFVPMPIGGGAPVTINPGGHAVSLTDSTNYVFPGLSIAATPGAENMFALFVGYGTSTASRIVDDVFFAGGGYPSTITNFLNAAGSTDGNAFAAIAEVPVGTTSLQVEVGWSGTVNRCGGQLFALCNLADGGAFYDTYHGTTDSEFMGVDVLSGMAVIGFSGASGTSTTATWTNLTQALGPTVVEGTIRITTAAAVVNVSTLFSAYLDWSGTPTALSSFLIALK